MQIHRKAKINLVSQVFAFIMVKKKRSGTLVRGDIDALLKFLEGDKERFDEAKRTHTLSTIQSAYNTTVLRIRVLRELYEGYGDVEDEA